MFHKVSESDFIRGEHAVLRFWRDQAIFQKLRAKNAGKPKWSFLDGPITANNPMGVHHAWGRTYKDAYQRYFAMAGRELRYQPIVDLASGETVGSSPATAPKSEGQAELLALPATFAELVALTRSDLVDGKSMAKLAKAIEKESGRPVFPISAPLGDGLEPLLDAIIERLGSAAREEQAEAAPEGSWSPL